MPDTVVEVVVDLRTRALNKTFDYVVPPAWVDRIQVGHRIYVSFGKQFCQAFVVGVKTSPGDSLKPVLELLDDLPVLTADMIRVVDWLCFRYGCLRLEAIHAVLPSAFRLQQTRQYRAATVYEPETALAARVWLGLRAKPMSFHQVTARFGVDAVLELERLIQTGAVREDLVHRDAVNAKTRPVLHPGDSDDVLLEQAAARNRRAPKQSHILSMLLEDGPIALQEAGLRPSDPAVKALLQDGLATLVEEEVYRAPTSMAEVDKTRDEQLTVWQQRALDIIVEYIATGVFALCVAHGVTGSGKTEVYLRAMEACLAEGGGAIVLVPEISLTPQMVSRFTARFGERIAVLHSGLSAGEKRDEWLRIRRGEARIAIGARSAVFAPVEDLRLIIVDEEHEPSYKQEESPRYDARDVARFRAQVELATVVLGSATPSLSAMHAVEQNEARIVSLPQRVNGRPLPPVEVVDMREELKAGHRSIFSRALSEGLQAAVSAGHQAVLFLNRRGFASFVMCRNCGDVPQCPNCDISLTLHRGRHAEWLRCHYCNYTVQLVGACRQCGEPALRPFGLGTQQVVEWMAKERPEWRVLRMDVDTTRRKGSHQAVIQAFLNHEADILVGTQMVAKGLDFPNVAFVGVISADTMLAVPDYRSAERTFQLLTQVAGRAGRALVEGNTVIQTYRPEHYAIQSAARHDYSSFYRIERDLRAQFGYPPFCELAVFTAIHEQRNLAEGAAKRFEREVRRRLKQASDGVLPAVPAGVERVQEKYRFQVVVKYSQWQQANDAIMSAFHIVQAKMRTLKGVCTIDVNAGRI